MISLAPCRWIVACLAVLGSACESTSSVVLDNDPTCVAYYNVQGSIDAGSACQTNSDCNPLAYCAAASCDGPGTCQQRCGGSGGASAESLACGCDAKVYAGTPTASRAGVRVADPSTCGVPFFTTPLSEGGLSNCSADADCPSGFICLVDCTMSSRICVAHLTAAQCADDVSPICGCDGRLYQNACLVIAAGVGIASARSAPNCGG